MKPPPMKRTLRFEREYPFSPEQVWRAIATSEAMEQWLMPNDFQPVVGHVFQFRTDPGPGFDGIVNCEVLEVDEPNRLSYSWRGGPVDTVVTYTLEPIELGTRLRFTQTGFKGIKARLVSLMLGSGWKKISRTTLPATIARVREDGTLGPDDSDHGCQGKGMIIARLLGPIMRLVLGRRNKQQDQEKGSP